MKGNTYQESPGADEGSPSETNFASGITRGEAERAAEGEAQGPYQVPEANVPAQLPGRGDVPLGLGLEHEEPAGDDEACAADDLVVVDERRARLLAILFLMSCFENCMR